MKKEKNFRLLLTLLFSISLSFLVAQNKNDIQEVEQYIIKNFNNKEQLELNIFDISYLNKVKDVTVRESLKELKPSLEEMDVKIKLLSKMFNKNLKISGLKIKKFGEYINLLIYVGSFNIVDENASLSFTLFKLDNIYYFVDFHGKVVNDELIGG